MKRLKRFDWQKLPAKWVIGVDEVGRGCLAGPVYAAAVLLTTPKGHTAFKDSKALTAIKRAELVLQLRKKHICAVGIASAAEIDQLNIFHASFLAMRRAIENLCLPVGWQKDACVLVDGSFKIPELDVQEQIALVGGDYRASPIGAASILAKVSRDEEMRRLAEVYPGYGFEKHKAYATRSHREALRRLGPCPEHRQSFGPVKNWQNEIDVDLSFIEDESVAELSETEAEIASP